MHKEYIIHYYLIFLLNSFFPWKIIHTSPLKTQSFMYLLCIFIVMSMFIYCMFMYLHRASWHSSATLTEACFFLCCKTNARVKPAKMGHGLHSSKLLCRSVYCLCVNVYCTAATGWLPNCS